MRVLIRFALIGVLFASCFNDIVGPGDDCTGDPEIQLRMFGEMRLAVGAADLAYADWYETECEVFKPLPPSELGWFSRDPTVVTLEVVPGEPSTTVLALEPGRTFVVASGRSLRDSVEVTVLDTVAVGPLESVSAGGEASCAVSVDGGAWCWGWSYPRPGTGAFDPDVGTCFGTPCSPFPRARQTDVVSVYVGGTHACALDVNGAASCWGDGFSGQLGNPTDGAGDPVEVSGGLRFSSLTLGQSHTCGIAVDAAAFCWGNTENGRVGTGRSAEETFSPSLVSGGLGWISLDAWEESTCGVSDAGHIYCWGILGEPNTTLAGAEACEVVPEKGQTATVPCAYEPFRMPLAALDATADSLFVQVAGTCALTSMGSVFCLDRGEYVARPGVGPLVSLAGGAGHTCGLTEAGAAWCWGSNGDGQLGNGVAGPDSGPVSVAGGHVFTRLAVGRAHSCAVTDQNEAWCWGANDLGQAGAPILDEPWSPVRVHGQR